LEVETKVRKSAEGHAEIIGRLPDIVLHHEPGAGRRRFAERLNGVMGRRGRRENGR
jgi:hypothetical protein